MGKWLRRGRRAPAAPIPTPDPSPEAQMELVRATEDSKVVQMFGPRVDAVAADLANELAVNHFAERFYNAMRGEEC